MSNPSPPTTSTSEPAGPTDAQLAEAKYWVDITLYVFSCFFTILVYDMVVAFPQEYKVIWKARNTVIKWLYIATRYWSFIAMLITLIMYNIPVTLERCEKYAWVEGMVPIGIVLLYQSILLARCVALWGHSKLVLFAFSAVFVMEFGFLIWVLTQLHALPYPGGVGPCVVDGNHKVITAYFLVPLGVDTLLTVVTFVKVAILKKSAGSSALLSFFAREGLFFFLCVFGLNLANGILYVQSNALIRTLFAGSAFVLSSILACRLVLSLRSQDARQMGVTKQNVYPLTAGGGAAGGKLDKSRPHPIHTGFNNNNNDEDAHNITVEFADPAGDLEKADSHSSSGEDLAAPLPYRRNQPFARGVQGVAGEGVHVHLETTTVS